MNYYNLIVTLNQKNEQSERKKRRKGKEGDKEDEEDEEIVEELMTIEETPAKTVITDDDGIFTVTIFFILKAENS